MQLKFTLSGKDFMVFEVDHSQRSTRTIFLSDDEILNSVFLMPNQRNYYGIEKRLQLMANLPGKDLEFILDDIENKGFKMDSQSNLDVVIQR